MARLLKIRKPRKSELRKLHTLLETALSSWQRRRAEVMILFAAGLNAIEIARLLEVHPNTIYNDLRAYANNGLGAVEQPRAVGAPVRITAKQVREIVKLAKKVPAEMGLPYGRWSLAKLRDYLIKQRVVKQISCKHLSRVLKKGDCVFGELNANSLATILNVQRSSLE